MEIRQLKYFTEICRYGSLSRAADSCFISVSGISLAISRLEDELNCKLFRRTPKGLVLTENGEYLRPYAESIVQQIEQCEAHFAAVREAGPHLPVAFSLGTLEELGGVVLSRFQQENANVTVDIREEYDTACDDAVENGEVEFALTVGPLNNPRLDSTLLFSTKNALLVQDKHPLANRSSISVKELEDCPLVIQRETTRSTVNLFACCQAAGFKPTITTYVDDVLLLFYLSSIGQAAGIVSYSLAKRINRAHIHAIPFEDPEMAWNIYLIKKKGAHLSAPARRFEAMLIQAAHSLSSPLSEQE